MLDKVIKEYKMLRGSGVLLFLLNNGRKYAIDIDDEIEIINDIIKVVIYYNHGYEILLINVNDIVEVKRLSYIEFKLMIKMDLL